MDTLQPVARSSPDVRKASILDAVLSVIIDVGYTQMTVADVARVAGVSTALVHYHFSSKTELIVAALRAACVDDKRLRESYAQADTTALGRLDLVLCGTMPADPADASWLLWIETWGETRREAAIRDVMDDLNRHEQHVLVGLIDAGIVAGEFQCPDPGAVAERLMALRDGLAIQFTLFNHDQPAHRFRDLLRGALRNNLGITPERYEQLLDGVSIP